MRGQCAHVGSESCSANLVTPVVSDLIKSFRKLVHIFEEVSASFNAWEFAHISQVSHELRNKFRVIVLGHPLWPNISTNSRPLEGGGRGGS